MYQSFIKPIFDRLFALVALIILSPLFVCIAFILYISNNGKVFFVQKRAGLNEKYFKMIKFKTMNDKHDVNGNLLPDMMRLHWAGKWLRKTSLDELPQLINVLRGEMSFVGPRPLLIQYLPLYDNAQKKRHDVKPGITGWAQVNGRNTISWQQKFELDGWYVNHISFLTDLKILFLTVGKVLKSEGVNESADDTMKAFTGNENP